MTTPRKTTGRTPAKKTPASKTPAKTSTARARVATRLGFTPVVEATLAATPLAPGDAAAAHLARALAAAIDRPRTVAERDEALHRHGPRLLAVLGELGATPTARHKLLGSPTGRRSDDDEPAAPATPVDPTPGLTALRQAHGRG